MSIYLDYNASAPIAPAVLQVMVDVYQNRSGNADSRTHSYGDEARAVVETARKQVASLLGISPSEVFFTSGATESSNIAIQGLTEYACRSGKRHIITSSIEHKAVLETVRAMERRERSKRATCSAFSSPCICWLTAGWVRNSNCAARVKLPLCAT